MPRGKGAGLNLLVPKPGTFIRWDEWMWEELREGGYLQRYIEKEKAQSVRRQRAVAKRVQNVQPKSDGSEWELKAAVPAREFFRWREADPDFWKDDSNLRLLKKDNPDLPIFVGRSRPSTAVRTSYPNSKGANTQSGPAKAGTPTITRASA